VDGPKTRDMAKVLTGLLILKINWEDSTLAIGKMTLNKEEALCFTNQETDTTECGWITCLMAKVEWSIQTETSTKACGIWASGVDTVYSPKDVAIISRVTGWMTREKVKAHIFFHRRIKFLLDNG
jgi:hypothetical protein